MLLNVEISEPIFGHAKYFISAMCAETHVSREFRTSNETKRKYNWESGGKLHK